MTKVKAGLILVSEGSIGGGDHFGDQTSGHDCESNQHYCYHGGERSTGDATTNGQSCHSPSHLNRSCCSRGRVDGNARLPRFPPFRQSHGRVRSSSFHQLDWCVRPGIRNLLFRNRTDLVDNPRGLSCHCRGILTPRRVHELVTLHFLFLFPPICFIRAVARITIHRIARH